MADFDSFNYDIKSKLPEWWKESKFLRPINEITQQLISDIIQELLSSTGVAQPLNCWLTIPEEYNWFHHYKLGDDCLKAQSVEGQAITTFFEDKETIAKVPNTKRNCYAKIQLKLLGTEIKRNALGEIDDTFLGNSETIKELKIQNADQEIIFKNIKSTSTIKIDTEKNEILVDDRDASHLIEGKIHKIKPIIKYTDFLEREIDKTTGNLKIKKYYDKETKELKDKNIELDDENKKTEIKFISSKTVNFDLQIYLKKPTYVTEQNIQVASVSAFPIERIELHGFCCHPFNNNSGYKLLWSKNYTEKSRTTFDRITTQFNCERFFIKVKFFGVTTPLKKGFPQEYNASDAAFQPNPRLDKWGKIYGLQRRFYKTDITKDEEPFTFPKYYPYSIEQDFWYEERMTNEYKVDEEAVNSMFIKDSDYNNIGMLECIYPFANDIWVYTETVDPTNDIIEAIKNIESDIEEDKDSVGKSWEELDNEAIVTKLNPQSDDIKRLYDYSYQSKLLKCSFDLDALDTVLPENIEITGIELKFKTETSVQSNTIKINEKNSKIIIPYFLKNSEDIILEKINIVNDEEVWMKETGYYTIGGENNLFGEKEITREQLFNGNDGNLDFELGFINENNFLESTLYIKDISLNLYYKVIKPNYEVKVSFNEKEIDLRKTDKKILMTIDVENKGKIEVHKKEIIIILPPELQIDQGSSNNKYNGYTFSLDIGEKFSIPNIPIIPTIYSGNEIKTGWFDILVVCDDKIITNEIIVRGKGT